LDNANPSEGIKDMSTSPAPAEPEAAKSPFGLNQAVLIALLAVAVFVLFRKFGLDGMISIALVAVGLGFVIFIHELGHFAVAKWCDVYVETFSIGFGPAIPGCSFKKGETLYKIAWFPLGGYVKMLGEGTESEEEDDNPRSFKNKSVWQRMAIISAGVIMNVILGFVCFIFVYETHGVERQLCGVGLVDVGSPAWIKGVPSGAIIDKIGDTTSPYFDDLKYSVSLSSKNETLNLVYHVPGEEARDIQIEPRREKDDQYPVIGIMPIFEPKLPPKSVRKAMRIPAVRESAAARAQPPFDFGDKIIAATDPANPAQVTPLPADHPMNELQRRFNLLAGKPMVMQVARQEEQAETVTPVTIKVPPAFHYTLPGLRMQMGLITALREGSAAAKVLKARDLKANEDGDILKWLEVTDAAGHKIRYVTSPTETEVVAPDINKVYVDPMRLPYELEKWAAEAKGEKIVRITVLRQVEHKARGQFPPQGSAPIELRWDDRWALNREAPYMLRSPQSIPGLGLAYQVDTLVADVAKRSAAEAAGLKPNDRIKAIRFQEPKGDSDESVSGKWRNLESDQWANPAYRLQILDYKEVTLKVESQGAKEPHLVHLFAEEDRSWPLADRGLVLMPASELQKAEGIGNAVYLGMQRTVRSIVTIYLNLKAMIMGRVSVDSMGGPILIATVAYDIASENVYSLIFFLGMISINLAVINFLPIPVLDGGHMVFLIWEKIRGVPASQTVQVAATYVGLLVILALMVFTFWIDITRLF